MPPRVIVQSVVIVWTKATRGAPRAHERAALPRAFAVPFSDAVYLHDTIAMYEREDFRPRRTQTSERRVPSNDGALQFHFADNTLTVGFFPFWGQPKRRGQRDLAQLSPNDYARLRSNARHTSYSGQYYSETVHHIAFGERIPENRFVDARPEHDVDWMADLF